MRPEHRSRVFRQRSEGENAESVEQFRHTGPDADLTEVILAANVQQHEIASTISLT